MYRLIETRHDGSTNTNKFPTLELALEAGAYCSETSLIEIYDPDKKIVLSRRSKLDAPKQREMPGFERRASGVQD